MERKNKSIKDEKNNQPAKTEKTKQKHEHKLITKVIVRIVSIILIAALLSVAGFFGYKKLTTVKFEDKTALIDRQLSFCQELVTAKYRYSDIITLKKSMGFAKSYSIVKYTGIIRTGIADFTDISYSVSIDGKKITLNVPPAEVLGNDLVSQEIFDEKQSVFVPITTQEIFDEIEEARRETTDEMIAEGVLDEAYNYAVKIITQFMYSLGFEEVEIKSRAN